MRHQLFLVASLLFSTSKLFAQTNLYVATDGSAPFHTVQSAIMAVPAGSSNDPVIIHIAPGTYKELIYIQHEKRFFKLVGENATNTILTFDLYAGITNAEGSPIGTFKTPSTTIDSDDFTAENITFENSAGPVGQALAIRVDGDRAVFRNCRFLGWQDTIFLNRGRQYFVNCYIAGHTDFIFGAATAWFQNCQINCFGNGYVTAASTAVDQPYGFVFSHCQITGNKPGIKTFLGRPWRIHASTIYLNCEMSDVVRLEGWNDWRKPVTHQTARYEEYNSTGPGASPASRPAWIKQLTKAEAKKITVQSVLGGPDNWNPMANSPSATASSSFGANRFNIQYAEAGGEKLLLDAHVPASGGNHPVAIIVHGGGWMTGDREKDIVPIFAPFATNFTWFTISYRLAPTNRWPACYDDMQTAIRWVKKHATEYKGDPKRIALLGYSAGGHLVCLAATRAKKDTRVQAVVGFAPPTEILTEAQRRVSLDHWVSMKNLLGRDSMDAETLEELKAISPINYVKPGLPPFLIIQGNADKTVLYSQTLEFAAKLKANGDSCDMITIPNGQHRIDRWPRLDPTFQKQMMAWLDDKLAVK